MTAAPAPETSDSRWVDCPSCRGPSLYAMTNPFRPFCCERCKQIDLGAWASEQFAVPTPTGPDDSLTEDQ